MREQRVVLEHQTDAATFRWDVLAGFGDHSFVDDDAPLLQPLQAGGDPEQRGLAAARGPEQTDQLTLRDGQGDVVQDPMPVEGMADAVHVQSLHGAAPAKPWPGRERAIAMLSSMTGRTPVATIVNAASDASPNCSSEAY